MFKTITRNTHIPICGLALAIASMANLLAPLSNIVYHLLMITSLTIIIVFSLTLIEDTNRIKEDLENPLVFGVFPTYFMALMLLSGYIEHFSHTLGYIIWGVALVANIIAMFIFSKKFLFNFKIKNVFPTWFVLFVGFLVGCITSPLFGMEEIGKVLFYVGFILYMLVLPLVIYRVFKVKQLADPAKPSLAIFCAPANLSIVAYLSVFKEQSNDYLLLFLLVISIITYAGVLINIPKILSLDFYPSFSALTFPLVISATSYMKLGEHFGISENVVFHYISIATIVLAVVVVSYIFILFCKHYHRAISSYVFAKAE
ncbi:MAG: TDT family transporter [Erysipelotrichales bacterium]